jgi:hypothetical protein
MSASSHRVLEIASLVGLVAGMLWLTAFAISGSVISILLILGAMLTFAAAKDRYRKGFVLWVALCALFISNPIDVKLQHGDHLSVRVVLISYGKPTFYTVDDRDHREEGALGGCVVTPFSPRWRLLLLLP